MNYNRIILAGNLVADPEIRYTKTGSEIGKAVLAYNESYTKKDSGEKIKITLYVDLVIFGRVVETFCQLLGKGSNVLVEGKLRSRTWEGRDGKNHKNYEVAVENFHVITFKDRGDRKGSGGDDEVPPF